MRLFKKITWIRRTVKGGTSRRRRCVRGGVDDAKLSPILLSGIPFNHTSLLLDWPMHGRMDFTATWERDYLNEINLDKSGEE